MTHEIRVFGSYGSVDAAAWDAVIGDGSPFLEHAFLHGLETFGCAVPDTGWVPRPITGWEDGELVAVAPGWVKLHSMGEFVYDHAWADAAHRAGFEYYPKLVVAAPFSPVTGDRLVVKAGHDEAAWRAGLVQGLRAASEDCHGIHVLFDTAEEARALEGLGGFTRTQFQFWWFNEGYRTFEDFLVRFRSKDRNKIRRERKEAQKLRIEAGTNPGPDQLRALHRFYRSTARQFGPWGRVYMSEAFFLHLGEVWGDRLHSVIAWDGEKPVAGAFNVVKGDRLYGRHWGCTEEHRFLHFEVCYYQAIEYCIAHGLAVFEPGHGGGHKYKRGFVPQTTYSSHWFPGNADLHEGLARYTAQERAQVAARVRSLHGETPLRPLDEE
ncbi:MAG: GNAT family N-acetyltransferase [Alphaproteobacteria bacterium]|nr:GNAT family N-acetyltransferase [Alphaproteobacteria bacterium]